MSKQRISGMAFDFDLSGTNIHADKVTLDISDNSQVAKTRGVTNGWTPGDCEASGELELDSSNFLLLLEVAKGAGSWRDMEPFDFTTYAKAADDELKIEAFGAKVQIASLADIDGNSADKTKHKLPFFITSPDFIKINGMPYLTQHEVRDLL